MKHLVNYLFLILLLTCKETSAADLTLKTGPILDAKADFQDSWGKATSDLQPYVTVDRHDAGWSLNIGFLAQTKFLGHIWLNTTNRVGSKLELCQTNGVQVLSENPDVLDAFHLPKQTTVSEIMHHSIMPRSHRAYQWLSVGNRPMYEGTKYGSADFSLQSAFDVSFTNDYVLKITPLIYKVETNEITAHLVEFPPIKIKLMADGNIQKLE